METELWPNLVEACRQTGTPLAMVNARLSARSAKGYARAGALARKAFAHLSAIGAQTEADGQRMSNPVNSFVGFAGDLSHSPNLNWLFLAAFSACSVAGVFVGHYLAGLIDGQRMKVYFGWLMLAIGVFIVVKELLR